MSIAMYFDSVVSLAGTIRYPSTRGPIENSGLISLSQARISTDALGTTTLTLQNILNGSNYWIAQTSNLSNVLATGTQSGAGTPIVISGLSYYATALQVTVRVRLAGYQPFETSAFLTRVASSSYIIQSIDGAF